MKYFIIFEETSTGFSAYCQDLSECVATDTKHSILKINKIEE